jgi:hypothetical protein
VPRKQPSSLQEARTDIKRRYKRGRKTERKVTGENALTETERIVKRSMFCYLKAQDFSYAYIADCLGITRDICKKWAQEDEIRDEVDKITKDFVGGAIKYAKTYAIEMLDMLAEIARTTDDDATAIKAITEFLDRIGLTKVNKSESVSAQTVRQEREIDITDKTGLLAALQGDVPPDVLHSVAADLDAAMSKVAEHTMKDVTHGTS